MPELLDELDQDAERLLHGECHLFAIAINRITGLPVAAYLDEDDEVEGAVLAHAFVVDGDDAIDVRGRVPLAEVLDEFEVNEPWFEHDISVEMLMTLGEGSDGLDETSDRWLNACRHAAEVADSLRLHQDIVP